ncbi:hypothetical protein ACHHYP_05726 [Achlya hypogyna]|uniref:Uncharacterized protein n=1 Tax=Achlya hypogyna TaxID=1202772 RepID=A0A1V9YWJ5_ACHHY|nr:hypothetical protein ACHHYP_05726 [Achlya hypogyna]
MEGKSVSDMTGSMKARLRSHANSTAATTPPMRCRPARKPSRAAVAKVPVTGSRQRGGQPKNIRPKAFPKGVRYADANYSSGTDMEEDEHDEHVRVGSGFPHALRTLEKDMALLKKQFPGLANSVIEQALIDTIPKRDDEHSYAANLIEASTALEAFQEEQLASRRSTLRSLDAS